MFIWRLWGNVWIVGDGGDFLTYLIAQIILITFLVLLTIVIIVPVLLFMAIRAAYRWYADQQVATATVSSASTGNPGALDTRLFGSCPNCGNTASRDIRPCIRCGR